MYYIRAEILEDTVAMVWQWCGFVFVFLVEVRCYYVVMMNTTIDDSITA